MANKQVDVAKLTGITDMTSTTGGTQTNGIRVVWDDVNVSRHELAVTLQNIADAYLDESQG